MNILNENWKEILLVEVDRFERLDIVNKDIVWEVIKFRIKEMRKMGKNQFVDYSIKMNNIYIL